MQYNNNSSGDIGAQYQVPSPLMCLILSINSVATIEIVFVNS